MQTEILNDSNASIKDLLEKEQVSDDRADSYCTSCREELDNLESVQIDENTRVLTDSNNFDNNFQINFENTLESLGEATRSFSKISIEHNNAEADNEKCLNSNDLRQIYILNTNEEVNVDEEIIIELLEHNGEFHPKLPPVTGDKHFCDKYVQTDPQYHEDNDHWDPEFSSEADLQKIDVTIQNVTTRKAEKQRSKMKINVQDNETIKKKAKEIMKPNYNSMTSTLLNRRKRLTHLSNDIYQLSCYLGEIRKALNAKEPLSTTIIPSPPAMTGYDSQFDFPNENRFGKLPITIESAKIVSKMSCGNSNSVGSSSSSLSRVGCGLSKLPIKRMNNGDNGTVSKRFMRESTNGEAFYTNKENRSNETSKIQSIHDSTSMYDYNPLLNRSKKNPKLN